MGQLGGEMIEGSFIHTRDKMSGHLRGNLCLEDILRYRHHYSCTRFLIHVSSVCCAGQALLCST